MESARLPRFKRSAGIASLQLTGRDREIIRHVQRHRFLRSPQIAALAGGSSQQISRRLQLLYHHNYLDRPRCQIDYYHQGGSRSLVYGLGSRGAALLRREFDIPFSRMEWTGKPHAVGRLFLEHALMVSDVMVALELACGKRDDVRLMLDDELSEPGQVSRPPALFHWQVRLNHRTKCGVIPDRVFALEFTGKLRGQNRAYFFLEADRGTMPVQRESLTRSSVHRKFLAYAATWTQNLHRTRFGWHRFRVLTVTTSAARMETLLTACRGLERGQGLFLFSHLDALQAAPDPLMLPWESTNPSKATTLLN